MRKKILVKIIEQYLVFSNYSGSLLFQALDFANFPGSVTPYGQSWARKSKNEKSLVFIDLEDGID